MRYFFIALFLAGCVPKCGLKVTALAPVDPTLVQVSEGGPFQVTSTNTYDDLGYLSCDVSKMGGKPQCINHFKKEGGKLGGTHVHITNPNSNALEATVYGPVD